MRKIANKDNRMEFRFMVFIFILVIANFLTTSISVSQIKKQVDEIHKATVKTELVIDNKLGEKKNGNKSDRGLVSRNNY